MDFVGQHAIIATKQTVVKASVDTHFKRLPTLSMVLGRVCLPLCLWPIQALSMTPRKQGYQQGT
jgi:hypothetical protein